MKKISIACLIIFIIAVLSFNIGGQYIREFFSPSAAYTYPELTTYNGTFYWSLPEGSLHFINTEAYIYTLISDDTKTREPAYYVRSVNIQDFVCDENGNYLINRQILKSSDMIIVDHSDTLEDGAYVKIRD